MQNALFLHGQTTQVMIGASPETDLKILRLSENLYKKFSLKRVYYSAYVSVNNDNNLPSLASPPLLRENRLYQADWLLRYYGFKADELLDESHPNFNNLLDPKCEWALRHLEYFPVDVNKADFYTLLRVPGIGVTSAKRIIRARRMFNVNFDNLKGFGVVLKRAIYFITCNGKYFNHANYLKSSFIETNLLYQERKETPIFEYSKQLSLFDVLSPTKGDAIKCISGNL